MAGQAGNPVNHPISPHVISGAFVQQYYHILHEQPDQVHKFYQDSSILGRPDSNGIMAYVTTMRDINEKIMSMDFRNCLTEIETADAQLSHKDGVLIVVTGSLTSDEGVFRRFTQSFFLAPQESGGYFVLTDVFRFISERKPAEINQVATQENEISQNVRPASETCSALPEPIPADGSVISDHVTADSNVTEKQISDLSANGTAIESNDNTQPPVQVPKEDPKKALLVAPPPPTQMDVTKKSYASIVKVMKEGPPTPVVKTTSSVSKQKPAPKPVSTAVEGLEKPSEKPTQAIGTGDGIVAQNNSSRNEQGYSIFIKNLPFHANIEMVEEEFKKFGTIKPGGVQVRHNKVDRFGFGFVEYESQQSMQAAIEASPIRMADKEVGIEAKRANSRGGRFQSGRGVYHGDNFRGRGSGYVDNTNYRSSGSFNRQNEGEMYNRRNDGGENYNRRNDGGENYNRRNDGGKNFSRRNDSGTENFNRRNDGGGENFSRRNDGVGENFNVRNDGVGENFNRRNNFRNQNDFPGRGRGSPTPGNSYYQNGNGRFSRVNNGAKQAPVAA
ncbi:Nuclear transport factor 2 (NTF2) family protein with RNA binding (RRM-RBD-RNP motifs) domain [Zea mays]|uniref:Nuclear transport factor 2 (NTF2) family protein with RNA binding (RRM-RBD-RNP motifs) domain n=1 Tax=Zea mays TaxID=4577 RepID=A0A1D6P8E4_MAIZE|nr:Nuclear transport factor 2 (NTF2) family protein with RNA binding (RRM-RBD-RNP motifs) domain [Zea mays]